MKRLHVKALAFSLALVLFGLAIGSSVMNANASTSSINATKEKIAELEKKKKSLQSTLKSLESEKKDIVNYITKLDEQLTQLENDLADTEADIDLTELHLEQMRKELAKAEEDEKVQYANMKSRIKFMYENGGSDYVSVLLGAADFSDLLNRTEYIEKISEYDKTMLDRYIETKHTIEEKEAEIEKTLQDLEDYRAELELEEEQVQEVREKKESELKSYEAKIASTESDVNSYSKQISAAEAELEKLVEAEKKRQEEEARKKKEAEEAAKKKSDTSDSSGKNSASGLRWPLNVSGKITSRFGSRSSPTKGASTYHKGIDIAVSYGTKIVAAGSGTVLTAGYNSAMGNYIVINHGGGLYTYYEHCSRFAVSQGAKVSKGQTIAYVGSTGISTGPHLHFGVYVNGSYVNPLNYVSP